MVFDLIGKVAIVTGAASGIGLQITKEFLRNGCKGVTLVDVTVDQGLKVTNDLKNEFGDDRVIFAKGDVSKFEEFEDTFKTTLEIFKNIDILVNNAGILNDAEWRKEIAVNLTGVTNGMVLAFDTYLTKYKQGEEALIINIASVGGLRVTSSIPVYAATKSAVIMLSRCWSVPEHYDQNKVKVITICPGATETFIAERYEIIPTLGDRYRSIYKNTIAKEPVQAPQHVAKEIVSVLRTCNNGTIWVIDGDKPFEYIFPEVSAMEKNVFK